MKWTQIKVHCKPADLDAVCAAVSMVDTHMMIEDFSDVVECNPVYGELIDESLLARRDEAAVSIYVSQTENCAEVAMGLENRLRSLAQQNGRTPESLFTLETIPLDEEDWANNWKQYFKPLCVGEKLLIKPSWEKVAEGEKRKILEIDPASSFGTGQHNTTQLCLELVEKNLHEGDSILDLGCGSGILSIGALLLGAESATAVDVDENSVKIAKENAEKNHISAEKYTAYCGNIIDDKALVEKIGTGYDLLCANIVADVLIGMSGIFGGFIKDGGTLIVSGIIDQRKDEVLDRLKAEGFELIEIREKEDWVAASFRK